MVLVASFFIRQIDLVDTNLLGPSSSSDLWKSRAKQNTLHLLAAQCKVPDLHILDHALEKRSHTSSFGR